MYCNSYIVINVVSDTQYTLIFVTPIVNYDHGRFVTIDNMSGVSSCTHDGYSFQSAVVARLLFAFNYKRWFRYSWVNVISNCWRRIYVIWKNKAPLTHTTSKQFPPYIINYRITRTKKFTNNPPSPAAP